MRSLNTALVIFSGLLFAASSMYPDSFWGPLACALSWAIFVWRALTPCSYLEFFLWGIAMHLTTFYWLPSTLQHFGGFPKPIALVLFFLYCVLSSIQFILFAFVRQKLHAVDRVYLAVPLAWLLTDWVSPKLFPWVPVHPLINWAAFSSLAEFVDERLLSAMFLWWLCAAFFALLQRKLWIGLSVVCVAGISVFVGSSRNATVQKEMEHAAKVRIALIQGNLGTEEKGDITLLEPNIETYRRLSLIAQEKGAEFIVWPESVVNMWTPDGERTFANTKFDPFPERSVPLLYGTLSFHERPEEEFRKLKEIYSAYLEPQDLSTLRYNKYNSAFALSADGEVLGSYSKRILMPFGEYLPFERSFPAIRSFSPYSGDFDAGMVTEPIEIPLATAHHSLQVMPLICYEDLVTRLAVEGSKNGANLLVNLTNDAWYGDSAAPLQHHLLARWKAIASRRYLLRATNTGLTAVVDRSGILRHHYLSLKRVCCRPRFDCSRLKLFLESHFERM